MKITIMQPYFFPYEGYYDLISKVDYFIFLDDVQYIRRGWVNRNMITNFRTLKKDYITVPVSKTSIHAKINEILIHDKEWVRKHLSIFIHNYGKKIREMELFQFYSTLHSYHNLNEMLIETIRWTSQFYGIETKFEYASQSPSSLSGEDRILQLCDQFNASTYYNLPGGVSLYQPKKFLEKGIELKFLNTDHYEKISFIESYFNECTSDLRLQSRQNQASSR